MAINHIIQVTAQLAQLEERAKQTEPELNIMVHGHNVNYRASKTHLKHEESKSILCGTSAILYVVNNANKEWIEQPDPDNILCKKCCSIALKHFNSLDMTNWHQETEQIKQQAEKLRSTMVEQANR